MSSMARSVRATLALVLAIGLADAASAGPEPDEQTKQTMQAWISADQVCRTTLAQDACQTRADTWNWLFQRGWRRNANGEFFQLQNAQEPLPGLSGFQFRR
ncbi:hypothetical protein WDZ92_30780 [Nostoc sp. NIES-2111]